MTDSREDGTGDVADRRTHDAVEAAIGLVAAGLLVGAPWLVDTSGPVPFYKGPLIFPVLVLALGAAASLPAWGRLLGARRRAGTAGLVSPARWPGRPLRVFALMAFFPAGVQLLGPVAASFVFAAAGYPLAGDRRPLRALGVAAAIALAVYLVFRLALDVWFPDPTLPTLLGLD